jgi:hypothetical protein
VVRGSLARASLGELLSGTVRKHWVYLSHDDAHHVHHGPAHHAAADEPGQPDDGMHGPDSGDASWDLAPCPLNVSSEVIALLARFTGREVRTRTTLQGTDVLLPLPPLSSAILERTDCRTPLADIAEAVRHQLLYDSASRDTRARIAPLFLERVFMPQWKILYASLSSIGFLTMTDHHLVGVG